MCDVNYYFENYWRNFFIPSKLKIFLQFQPIFLDFLPFPYYLFIGNENYQKL